MTETKPKSCPACAHIERATIDGALSAGLSPRSLVRRYAGLTRKAVARHRDGGHHETRLTRRLGRHARGGSKAHKGGEGAEV